MKNPFTGWGVPTSLKIIILLSGLGLGTYYTLVNQKARRDNRLYERYQKLKAVKYEPLTLSWLEKFYDDYYRPDIVHIDNLADKTGRGFTEPQFREPPHYPPRSDRDPNTLVAPAYREKDPRTGSYRPAGDPPRLGAEAGWPNVLALLYSIQYQPGDISPAHQGIANSCEQCHSFGQTGFRSRCLDCHVSLKKKIDSERGFHASKGDTPCETCHLEHGGGRWNLVDLSGFDHNSTEYSLYGYHQWGDCYRCHKRAAPFKPNTILSLNQKPRSLNRFSIPEKEYNQCTDCHPDPHWPTFGKNCADCHPVYLRWYQ